MTDIHAIIGFGISGMLVYLELIKSGIKPSNIFIFDPDLIGGDLARDYSSITSNTTWSKILSVFPEAETEFPEFDPDKTTNIMYLPKILERLCQKTIRDSEIHLTTVSRIEYKNDQWLINNGSYTARTVYLCQGGQPKAQDIPGKSIPLHIALDKDLLKRHIVPGKTYTIFGLSHSGTLVLKNLTDLDTYVNAIYRSQTPFQYARDGFYSGIKQESETIADNVLKGSYPNVKLIKSSDIDSVSRALIKTTAFISAIGFEPRKIDIIVEDSVKSSLKYSPETALIDECPRCYGFGMAYPSVTVIGKTIHNDISFTAFHAQISRIFSTFNSIN
jgi:hypothetical protein